MFKHHCVNDVAMSLPNSGDFYWNNIEGNVARMLWQHHSPTLVTDIETKFRQHCVNVVAMLLPSICHQYWDNVKPMLYEHCGSFTHKCWWSALRKSSGNIVWKLWQCHSTSLITNIETTFSKCSVNAVAILLLSIGQLCWDKVEAMCICCGTVAYQCWLLNYNVQVP